MYRKMAEFFEMLMNDVYKFMSEAFLNPVLKKLWSKQTSYRDSGWRERRFFIFLFFLLQAAEDLCDIL